MLHCVVGIENNSHIYLNMRNITLKTNGIEVIKQFCKTILIIL